MQKDGPDQWEISEPILWKKRTHPETPWNKALFSQPYFLACANAISGNSIWENDKYKK
jgi:hypothetical protein